MRHYATEAPFVVSTKSGGIKSTHWTSTGAIEAAKASKTLRLIHGRDKGAWRVLLAFKEGKRVEHATH